MFVSCYSAYRFTEECMLLRLQNNQFGVKYVSQIYTNLHLQYAFTCSAVSLASKLSMTRCIFSSERKKDEFRPEGTVVTGTSHSGD